MANKRIEMIDLKHLLRLKRKGYSNRRIGEVLDMDRNTVNDYVKFFDSLDKSYEELYGMSEEELHNLFPKIDPKDKVRYEVLSGLFSDLEADYGKVGATYQNVWERYKREHPDGYRYTQFKKHFQGYLKRNQISARWEHKFGDKMFMDFTGKKLPVTNKVSGEVEWKEVLVVILGGSQYTYVEAVNSQQLEDVLNAVQNAFLFFAGVTQAIVCDNLKSAVTKADSYEPEVNRNFNALALHYSTVVLPTRSIKPKDKALVEGAVKLVYQWIFRPLDETTFFSLADLNAAIRYQLDTYNNYLFQHRNYSRRDLFISQEKPLLEALPAERFERRIYREVKVNKDIHVWFNSDQHYYSVPYQYKGKRVRIEATSRTIEIYCYHNHGRIATHQRSCVKGGFTTNKDHLPPNIRFVKDWSLEQFSKLAEEVGSDVYEFPVWEYCLFEKPLMMSALMQLVAGRITLIITVTKPLRISWRKTWTGKITCRMPVPILNLL
jgi:transposase